jgi:hypothetical protein
VRQLSKLTAFVSLRANNEITSTDALCARKHFSVSSRSNLIAHNSFSSIRDCQLIRQMRDNRRKSLCSLRNRPCHSLGLVHNHLSHHFGHACFHSPYSSVNHDKSCLFVNKLDCVTGNNTRSVSLSLSLKILLSSSRLTSNRPWLVITSLPLRQLLISCSHLLHFELFARFDRLQASSLTNYNSEESDGITK